MTPLSFALFGLQLLSSLGVQRVLPCFDGARRRRVTALFAVIEERSHKAFTHLRISRSHLDPAFPVKVRTLSSVVEAPNDKTPEA